MNFHLLVLAAVLAGCAGDPVSKKATEPDAAADVSVAPKDFSKRQALAFVPQQDFYPAAPKSTSVLISESLDRADAADVRSLTQGKDPLTAMVTSCYRRDFSQGLAMAESLYDTHQKFPSYWNQVATCHLLSGNERKALLFYNKAIEVSPNYAPALNNIAVIYGNTGQPQKALVALRRALAQSKFAKVPRYNQANLFLRYGHADAALGLFQALAAEAPTDLEVRIGLANALALTARWPEAFDAFSALPERYRTRPEVGLNMALAAHKTGKQALARSLVGGVQAEREWMDYRGELAKLTGE